MKFSEIIEKEEELEQLKELKQKESIGQQLEVMSKVKEIEYQNSLVMMSLEQYNSKYEQLKLEQTELLNKTNKKIEQLQQSNEILTQNLNTLIKNVSKNLENEVSTLSDSTQSLIRDTSNNIDSLLSSKLDEIRTSSFQYIEQVEKLEQDAKKRFESFYGRKQIIDYLIIASLTITPILLIFLMYWTFFKK